MTETIIAGVDDRAESQDAVALASELARGGDAQLELTAVLDYNPVPIDIEPYEKALREHFAAIFKRVDEAKPELDYRRHDLTGSSPPRALSELAEKLDAKLIVVGSTHRGLLGRVLPGSVGDRLLNGGPRAVAVAPRGYAGEQRRIKRIGVGFNGCPESKVALSFAAGLAEGLGAELSLIAVVEPPSSTMEEIAAPFGYEEAVIGQLESALVRGKQSVDGIKTETSLLHGQPAQMLATESAGLDLLVVGSRGYGPIRRALLGDVAAKLTRKANCPLIVVPRGSSTTEGEAQAAAVHGHP